MYIFNSEKIAYRTVLVQEKGLEPSRIAPYEPESYVFAYFTTPANKIIKANISLET